MLCIGNIIISLFAAFSIISLGTIGITGYHFLTAQNQKESAELLFFCALVAMIFLLIFYVLMLHHAKQRTRTLEHLLNRVSEGGYIDKAQLNTFGDFGNNIMSLVKGIQDISGKRAKRIRYLNNVLSTLLVDSTEAVLLLDSEGIIMQASLEFFTKFTKPEEQGSIYGSSIERFYSNTTFPNLRQEIINKHKEITVSSDSCTIRFIPMFSDETIPDGFFAILQKKTVIGKMVDKVMDSASSKEASPVKESSEAQATTLETVSTDSQDAEFPQPTAHEQKEKSVLSGILRGFINKNK